MVIRKFRIGEAIYDGYYLNDGTDDIECLTPHGREIFFSWEYTLIG
jgi:hypothetical protein